MQPPRRWSGHLWTIGPKLREFLVPTPPPDSRPWRRRSGTWNERPVHVNGRYAPRPNARTLIVIVHGLGGCSDSGYCISAARIAADRGFSSLRLSLRGANRNGEDLYHGGLVEDVRAALTAPTFDRYRHKFVLGFSLGGHIALRAALDLDLPDFRAAAAVCSPLDLEGAQRVIDGPDARVYRRYLLWELRQTYRAVWRRRGGPVPYERVRLVRSLREWDALTVVPRFGFEDVQDYYRTVSVAGSLEDLERPSLLVAARPDPMVPPSSIAPGLPERNDSLTVRWSDRGGHVYFPGELDLGFDGDPGLVPQLLAYFEARAADSSAGM